MASLTLNVPRKVAENFNYPATYRVFKGGRGSAKTRSLASMACLYVMRMAIEGKEGVFLCGREHLNSLDESSLSEIKAAISEDAQFSAFFDVGEKYVRTRCRRIDFAFAGLRHNLDSLKSKARILGAWIDEGESVSEVAWRKLLPTVREEGAEIWISYNPESPDSATHKRFVETPPTNCIVTTINWRDNPWFPQVLNQQRLDDQRLRPDIYEHVWEGSFLTLTDAQVFAGKFAIEEFSPLDTWDGPYQGVDFGFAQDPTTAVQCYIHDKQLMVHKEAGKVGLELDATGQFITDRIASFDKHAARADSARPESISYLRRHGLPRIESVKKWPGSVEDGVSFIKSFERVVIHPDCTETAREFRLYSYKVDRLSGDIKPIIVDANNHYIDAIRYALAPMIKDNQGPRIRAL
jgi:phage terminase large subunit